MEGKGHSLKLVEKVKNKKLKRGKKRQNKEKKKV